MYNNNILLNIINNHGRKTFPLTYVKVPIKFGQMTDERKKNGNMATYSFSNVDGEKISLFRPIESKNDIIDLFYDFSHENTHSYLTGAYERRKRSISKIKYNVRRNLDILNFMKENKEFFPLEIQKYKTKLHKLLNIGYEMISEENTINDNFVANNNDRFVGVEEAICYSICDQKISENSELYDDKTLSVMKETKPFSDKICNIFSSIDMAKSFSRGILREAYEEMKDPAELFKYRTEELRESFTTFFNSFS